MTNQLSLCKAPSMSVIEEGNLLPTLIAQKDREMAELAKKISKVQATIDRIEQAETLRLKDDIKAKRVEGVTLTGKDFNATLDKRLSKDERYLEQKDLRETLRDLYAEKENEFKYLLNQEDYILARLKVGMVD